MKHKIGEKNLACWFFCGFVVLYILSIVFPCIVNAAVPDLINYQGRLRESGQPVSGTKTMEFKIHSHESNSAQVWTSGSVDVTVSTGVFSYRLGTANSLSSIDWSAGSYWLEIDVESDTLSPRERFITMPYAFEADALSGRSYEAFVSTWSGDSQSIASEKTFQANTKFPGSGIWDSTGKLGIGKTNPGYNIEVVGTGYFSGALTSLGALSAATINTGDGDFEIGQDLDTTDNVTFNQAATADYITALGGIYVGAATDPGEDNLVVDGNVGIGTAVLSAYKLTVNGGISGTNVTSGTDPGHTHTDISVSGIDISSSTTLAVASPITFTAGTDTIAVNVLKDIVAGGGLTGGSDDVLTGTDADVTLAIGEGDGINVTADAISVDVTDILGTGLREDSNLIGVFSLMAVDGSSTSVVYVDADGNVGVGTTHPRSLLEINGDLTFSRGDDRMILVEYDDDGAGSDLSIVAGQATGANSGGDVILYGGFGNSGNSNGDVILAHTGSAVRGYVGIGLTNPSVSLEVSGKLKMRDDNIMLNSQYLSGDGDDEGIYVKDDDGNVGIGTSNPKALLSIESPNSRSLSFMAPADSTGSACRISLWDGARSDEVVAMEFRQMSTAGSPKAGDIRFLPSIANQSPTARVIISTQGYVGINNMIPTAWLHVAGNIKAELNDISDDQGMQYNTTTDEIGYDVAELFETTDDVEIGDILVIDGTDNTLSKSSKPYQKGIIGVVSGAPAILFEGSQLQVAPTPFSFKKGKKPPVALCGRIPVKVNLENGSIKRGDYLTTSSKSGYAMKAGKTGEVIGLALENYDGTSDKEMITIFVNPGIWVNPAENEELKARIKALEDRISE